MKRKCFILTMTFLCAILFSACDMFDSKPKEFLQDYSSIAYISGVHGNGAWIEKDGWVNISPQGMEENYIVIFDIENSGGYELDCEIKFPEGCVFKNLPYECTTNSITINFSNDILASIDGDVLHNNISPTIKLFRKADGRPQSVYKLKMRCNSPPEQIPFALSQMIEVNNDQLIIAFDLPKLSGDVRTLTIKANNNEHNFNVNADGTLSAAAGEAWYISQDEPTNICATFLPDGPLFSEYSYSNWDSNCTAYYITTDIKNLRNIDVFYIDLILTDEGGLTSQYTISSREGGGSGSITPPTPPAKITFGLSSASGNGNNITVSASNGSSTVTSDITSWSIELWQGTIKTPTTYTSNSITIPSTYAAGSYIIKIKAVYKGSTYNGELLYTKS